MRNNWHPLFLLFIAFALFGFFYKLIFETAQFLYTILLIGLAGLVFYGIYRFIILPRKLPRQRQSTNKTAHTTSSYKQGKSQIKGNFKKKRTKDHPFTVIEGNKGKKKKPYSS
jgi:hypothetical protein